MDQLFFKNLEIRQFRRFERLTVEPLGRVNLIVGKNNVGKSTLLEAINLYANIGSPQVMLDILDARDDLIDRTLQGRNGRRSKAPAVWSLFHGHQEISKIDKAIEIGPISSPDSTLRIGIDWYTDKPNDAGQSILQLIANSDLSPEVESIPALTFRIAGMTRVLRLDRDFTTHCQQWDFQPQSFLELATRCTLVGPNGLLPSQIERMWENVALTDLEQDVTDSLRLIVPAIEDFTLIRREQSQDTSVRIRADKNSPPQALRCMGDGMNRLFGLGMAMVTSTNGLLLIDEIENGIHYSVLPSLWRFVAKLARRLNVQVIATSHSWDSIRAFHEATLADKEVDGFLVRLEVRDGELRAVTYDETRLERFVKEEIEVR